MVSKIKKQTYASVFKTPEGEKVLKDLMDFCHFMQPTHDPQSATNSAFNEGKRRVLLRIMSFLSPEKAAEIYNNPLNLIKEYEVDL